MHTIHEHSLSVRLDQETGKPEIYCLDPQCHFRVDYDPESATHWKIFGRDIINLPSQED